MKPLGPEHNRAARNHLAEQGIEMTPDELIAERKAAYATIREEMRKLGHSVPDSDEELFEYMRKNYPRSERRSAMKIAKSDVAFEHGCKDGVQELWRVLSWHGLKRHKLRCSNFYASEADARAHVERIEADADKEFISLTSYTLRPQSDPRPNQGDK